MFEWHPIDESYIQSIKVFTSGVNLPGGVLLRTSRVAPLKHGESVGIAETFIPGLMIRENHLVPIEVGSTVVGDSQMLVESSMKISYSRYRGAIRNPNGSLDHRGGILVLNKDWEAYDVLAQMREDGWIQDDKEATLVGWPSVRFEATQTNGKSTIIFELIGD